MPRLTPQQKKKHSLEKDHYNKYGQSDKAARRIVPLRATKGRRAVRHMANVAVKQASLQIDVDAENTQEALAIAKEKSRWAKHPSPKLKDLIAYHQERRIADFGRKKRNGRLD
jgi:hypothetical protein